MRTLYLLRHAEAAYALGGNDFDRPLTEAGRQAAVALGQRLYKQSIDFDHVYCSTALRALSTARSVLQGLQQDNTPIIELFDLYQADVDDVMDLIHSFPSESQHILLVGHNPTMTDLANGLTNDNIHLAPGSLYVIELRNDDWQSVMLGSGRRGFVDL